MGIRQDIVNAQRGPQRFTRDYPKVPMSSSSEGDVASASSETSDFIPFQGINYENADAIKPGLKQQLRMVAQARRKFLTEPNSDWATDKAYGWTVAEDFDGSQYLKPATKDSVGEGDGWWASLNDYLNALCDWVGEGGVPRQTVEDAVYGLANEALMHQLSNLDPDYGFTGTPGTPEHLKHRAEMAAELAKYPPEVIERENRMRQMARNARNNSKLAPLTEFNRQNAALGTVLNAAAPGTNAVLADDELWYKTSPVEVAARGLGDFALDATMVAAPELGAGLIGSRSAFLGARPILNYAIAGGLAPIATETLNRGEDVVMRGLFDQGTANRPFDPADLGLNMALGAGVGAAAGKIAPRPKANYEFVKKGKNIDSEIAAMNQTGRENATLQDIIEHNNNQQQLMLKRQNDEILKLEKEIAELKAKDAAQVQPEIEGELKRMMWERGNQQRLEEEAMKAGKSATAEDFITGEDLADIALPQKDFKSKSYRGYDLAYPTSAHRVPKIPEPGAYSEKAGQWLPLATLQEGMENKKLIGATVGDLRKATGGSRGFHLGEALKDPDLEPNLSADTRSNLLGFKYADREIELPNGQFVKVPTVKNGQQYQYIGWDEPTPNFMQKYLNDLGIDTQQYPMEFIPELYRLIKQYKAGDPMARKWIGEGERILTEAERRAELQALKGKTLQSGTPGMASDNPMKNMAVANWIENEGQLGRMVDGNFVPATPEQQAAYEQASRQYSARSAMYKPTEHEVRKIEKGVKGRHSSEMEKTEKEMRSNLESQQNKEKRESEMRTKKLDALQQKQERYQQEARGKHPVRKMLKGGAYLGGAVGQALPLSEYMPGIEYIPNKTSNMATASPTTEVVDRWKQGMDIPVRASDPYWGGYIKWRQANPKEAMDAEMKSIERRGMGYGIQD